jgi:tetratricopeptide (TPR) repeat protein
VKKNSTSRKRMRAQTLAPGNAEVLRESGHFAALMGHFDVGVAAGRYEEAVATFAEAISLEPRYRPSYVERGLAYYRLGDLPGARASCEMTPDFWGSQQCFAVIYDKLGRHADAEAELAKMKAAVGDAAAYQYATIYAQWGNRVQALASLETALRLRDPGLSQLKTDSLLDPLREEPRYKAIERELKFPN